MDNITLFTKHQRIEADANPNESIVEPKFSITTLYLPGDHFKYNGKCYIVKKCYQAGDPHGD